MNHRRPQATGAARSGDGEDAARAAKVRRSAWLLAAFAVCFYLGYLAWMYLRSGGGA